jgi:hypothetical protein
MKIFLTTIISIFMLFTVNLTSQDAKPSQGISGQLFTLENSTQLLEVWDNLGIFGSQGFSCSTDFHPLSKNELLGKTDNGSLFVCSTKGEILATLNNCSWEISVSDGKIYSLQGTSVSVYNNRLKLINSFVLNEIPSYYTISGFCVTGNGTIFVASYYFTPFSGGDYKITTYDSQGKLLKETRNLYADALIPAKSNSAFAIIMGDQDSVVQELSPAGEEISRFSLQSDRKFDLKAISPTLQNTFIATLYSYPDTYAYEFSQKGKLIREYSFETATGDQITDFGGVAKTSLNALYLPNKGPDGYRISKFNSRGKLVKHIFNGSQAKPSPVPGFKRPDNLSDICQGPGRTLLGLDASAKIVYQFNANGKVLGSFQIPGKKSGDLRSFRMNSKEEIHILSGPKILVFSLSGKRLRTIKPKGKYSFSAGRSLEIDSKDNIYILKEPENSESHFIVVLDPQGKPVKQIAKNLNPGFPFLPYVRDIAMDAYDDFFLYYSDGMVQKISGKGELKGYFQTIDRASSISIGPSGNVYICSNFGSRFLVVLDSSFNEIYRTDTTYQNTACFNPFEGPTGRVYVPYENGTTVVFNSLTSYSSSEEKATISGSHKALKGFDTYYPKYSDDLVFIEGVDNKGNRFSSFATLDESQKYSFANIPIGSKVKVWINHPLPETVKYKKPLASFTVSKTSHKVNFKYSAITDGSMTIIGRVVYNSGAPVHGALVRSGKSKAVSDLNGNFYLSVPANSTQRITVSKDGLNFEDSPRVVNVKNNDIFFIDFIEK